MIDFGTTCPYTRTEEKLTKRLHMNEVNSKIYINSTHYN